MLLQVGWWWWYSTALSYTDELSLKLSANTWVSVVHTTCGHKSWGPRIIHGLEEVQKEGVLNDFS